MSGKVPKSIVDDLAEVRRTIDSVLQGQRARVLLFGSRAWGGARRTSDIDIGVLAETPLREGTLSLVREALEESHVPYAVDVIDLSEVDEQFRRKVLREGIRWRD